MPLSKIIPDYTEPAVVLSCQSKCKIFNYFAFTLTGVVVRACCDHEKAFFFAE